MTHNKVFANLDYIKTNGIKIFIDNQNVRIEILNYLLTNFDDGRSKNFYCISCALLPVDKLQEVHSFAKTLNEKIEAKEKCYISPQINRAVKNKSYFYNCYGKEEKFYIENQG